MSECDKELSTEESPVYFFKMRLASLNIEVECTAGRHYSHCIPYLSQFSNTDIVVHVDEKEVLRRYSYILTGTPDAVVQCENEELGAIEAELIYQSIVTQTIDFGVFLMHGSVVALDNNAYMFAAPSGTGKTTRTRLWLGEFPSSIVVNGDKPLIRVTDTDILACGTPWCGKEGWNTNTMVPIRAIFLLERADTDSIEEISLGEAFPTLLQQTYCPSNPEAIRKTISLLKAFENKVRVYRFCSTPTPESIRLAYNTAKPQ